MASTVSRACSSPSWRSRAWTAGISLDFSSQSRCASTKVEPDANALRICAALRSWKASKLCSNALPSTAMCRWPGGVDCSSRMAAWPENVSDGSIGWRPTPFQPEELAQTNEMDIDETMDTPVRVGPGYHRQNSEQNHMGQTIQLAFSPSGVV